MFRKKAYRVKVGTFMQKKRSLHRNIQYSSYLLSNCPRNLLPGLLRKTKMPNCVIFIGTNHGGDSLAGTSTTNMLVAQSLLTTVRTQ